MAEPTAKVTRRPFPQLNAFRPFVMDELRRRKSSYPNPINTPFVRLTSAKHDPKNNYVFFTMGLHGYGADDINIFDITYGGGKDVVGYASDLTSNDLTRASKRLIFSDELAAGEIPSTLKAQINATDPALLTKVQTDVERQIGNQRVVYAGGAHPIPGITNVSVKRSGLGAPLVATIRWSCYNRTQLEFLRNHFMVAGGYCVVEFGQNFHDKTINKIIDFQNVDLARQEIVKCILEGRKYVIDNYVEPNEGNYDFLVGVIGNYEVDLDAKTGIYNCTTTLVSVGEEAWGLNSHMTIVRKNESKDSNDALKPSTFHDFFRVGFTFDKLIEAELKAGNYSNVANYRSTAKDFKGDAFSGYSNNAEDYRFVSWNFLCNVVIPRMMELISDVGIKADVENFIKFYINQQDEPSNPDDQTWIGDHKELRSTDPDIMLIIKSGMKEVPAELTTIKYFDSFPQSNGFRGKLRKGIWLNAGMIRQCFLQTTTFQQAIMSILIRMNSATAGYWQLQLFFDSEEGKYKIIDNKYSDGRNKTLPTFYKFNVGGKGEMLNVNLDSSFPPELVTQMMLYAKFKGESEARQKELIKRYPAIGTTSTFALALNWTSLVDVIDLDIVKARENKQFAPLQRTDLQVPAKGLANTQTNNTRTTNRIAGGDPANLGAPAVAVRTSPNPGQKQSTSQPVVLDVNKPSANPLSLFSSTGATRESVKPPTGPRPAVVQRADQYKILIESTAKKYNVDPDLVRAVIAQESGFKSSASRTELLLGDASQGLMQITLGTAKGLGFRGTSAELATPENSVEYGTKFLAECLRTKNGNIEDAISMYNGGNRPRLGFGGVATQPTRVCLAWSQTVKGQCDTWREVPVGQYGNQPHVNKVIGYYNQFKADSGKAPFTGQTTNGTLTPKLTTTAVAEATAVTPNPTGNPAPVNTQEPPDQAEKDELAQIEAKKDNINIRFGKGITNVLAISPSAMVNLITKDGYLKHPVPNSFVAPFPTTTAVEVELQGISGISVSDAFLVDRLPFIFERYGVFQVTEISDTILERGWTTKIRGYFKLIWLNGDGPDKNPEQ
jgi:hypothetical protein